MRIHLFLSLCLFIISCKKQKKDVEDFNSIVASFPKIENLNSSLFEKKIVKNDTINHRIMDSIFQKYECTYENINKEMVINDFTIETFSEYEVFPKNQHNLWYKIGKLDIDKNNYGLLIKLYDVYSSRYFLFIFDKQNNRMKSSIGLFGYLASTSPTEIGDYFNPNKIFMNSQINGHSYIIKIEGSNLVATYNFVLENGLFKLIQKEIKEL